MKIKVGDRVYDTTVGRSDNGIVVGFSNDIPVVYWDGLGGAYNHIDLFSPNEINKSVLPYQFKDNYFATLGINKIALSIKKVKDTKLSRKMYPDAEIEGDYLVVEV